MAFDSGSALEKPSSNQVSSHASDKISQLCGAKIVLREKGLYMKNNLRATRGVTTLAFTITGLLLMTISVLLVNRQIQLIYNVQQRDYQQEQSMQLAEATLVKVQNNLRLNVWRDLWISDGDQDGWLGVAGKGNASNITSGPDNTN